VENDADEASGASGSPLFTRWAAACEVDVCGRLRRVHGGPPCGVRTEPRVEVRA
jgi:hypothetical protein